TKYNLPSEFLLFLGTLEPRKNILAIIEAFVLAKPHLSSTCELIIAGSLGWKHGPILRAIARTSGVRYIGYVDEIDKPALYCLSTIFVFPSLYEGFGLPVLEAMASKTAVITSARSSLAEVVGDAGYLVHPLYVSEIADAIITLCTDDTLRELYRIKGYTRSCDFSWQKTAKTFLTYIEQCFMNTDQTLTFGALKEQLAVFYKERDWDQFHDPKNVADAISIEVGELLELMLWKNPEEVTSRMETDPSYRTAIEEELVDVLLYCFNFAISTNIELAPVILRKMAKNAQKYPSNVMKGNAPDRFVIAQKKAQ
ncbi:MAG: glycosyltransferase, partial [Candidatus Magasanikbacteria bacterium]|nr:glycosyltransferase [Candidatus Magasanikbacteria bacterium]